jgi:hypothetical protein
MTPRVPILKLLWKGLIHYSLIPASSSSTVKPPKYPPPPLQKKRFHPYPKSSILSPLLLRNTIYPRNPNSMTRIRMKRFSLEAESLLLLLMSQLILQGWQDFLCPHRSHEFEGNVLELSGSCSCPDNSSLASFYQASQA